MPSFAFISIEISKVFTILGDVRLILIVAIADKFGFFVIAQCLIVLKQASELSIAH